MSWGDICPATKESTNNQKNKRNQIKQAPKMEMLISLALFQQKKICTRVYGIPLFDQNSTHANLVTKNFEKKNTTEPENTP